MGPKLLGWKKKKRYRDTELYYSELRLFLSLFLS